MVPRRLRELRKKYGYSLEYVGISIGLDPSAAKQRISKYELGVNEPSMRTVKLLAKLFDVPVPYFYAEDDAMAEHILNFSEFH